ncbi:MAG: hypothetical protein NTY81_02995 [Candidatus Staskawiczbacteria bacterium]|nr:hypothetical protein [Candidatus Staskawiczbacteria bacterium]
MIRCNVLVSEFLGNTTPFYKGEENIAMATIQEIMAALGKNGKVYPSSTCPGWHDISPPVRVCNGANGTPHQLICMINEETQQVILVGESVPRPIGPLRISDRQGPLMPIEIPAELLVELEEFLNTASDDKDGNGEQTEIALVARNLLDQFCFTRQK